MSSLNTKDEQAPKVGKEDGYSIVAAKVLESKEPDAEQATDEESNEELLAVQDFSNVKDLQSAILSYLFAFPVAPYISPASMHTALDTEEMVVNFSNKNDKKIYEPPEDRQKLVALLAMIVNSAVTTPTDDGSALPDRMQAKQNFLFGQAPKSAVEKKHNPFFEMLTSKLNLSAVRCVQSTNKKQVFKAWTQSDVNELNNQIYTKILPIIKTAFKHDAQFSKMLELAEEQYRGYGTSLDEDVNRAKKIKRIVDIACTIDDVGEKVENNGLITSIFLKSSKLDKQLPYKIKFKDGLVLTMADMQPGSHSHCYQFKKNIIDKETGLTLHKNYIYSPVTKTLIEHDIDTGKCVYKNYSNSKIESYNDGYIHTIDGKKYLYCNGGKKIVCIDSNDKRFGFEFTAVTDEKQKQLVKNEPEMTFGYWTTFNADDDSVYKTFGQKKKNDFSYNPAHDAKTGNEVAVSIKNDTISSISEENKSNFIKAKRCIDGLNLTSAGEHVFTLEELAGIQPQEKEKYANFIEATCDFFIHKREREKMYSKSYDYEEKMNNKLKKEKEKKDKKEAKEKEKKDKKEAKEKEKNFKKIANDIYKEKLEQARDEEEKEQVDTFTEQEINDVKNIIARLKQDALRWDSSRLMNTEETGLAQVLNFLLKIITFGTVDLSKRRKEEVDMNNQEIIDGHINNVELDIKDRVFLLNKLAKYITLYGDMNGVIEDLEGLQQNLTNVSQEYSNFAKEGNQDIKDTTTAFSNIVTSDILSKSMERHDKAIEKKKKQDEIKLNALEEARKKMGLEK